LSLALRTPGGDEEAAKRCGTKMTSRREAEGTNMGEIDRKVNREILISKKI
jgi:hypothetical protein